MGEEKLIGIDLSIASEEVIQMLLDDPRDESIFSEVLTANRQRPEVLRLLREHPGIPSPINTEVSSLLNLPVESKAHVAEVVREEEQEEVKLQKSQNFLQRIQRLSIGERIFLAIRGGKTVRSVLMRDANKEVIMKVLENPRLTESEIELISQNPSVPEDALRYVAKKGEWIKKYPIMVALVSNPKTPPGVSMPFIAHLRTRELTIMSKNKNIPDAVRNAANRYLRMRKL
jgi:hypothetical protein